MLARRIQLLALKQHKRIMVYSSFAIDETSMALGDQIKALLITKPKCLPLYGWSLTIALKPRRALAGSLVNLTHALSLWITIVLLGTERPVSLVTEEASGLPPDPTSTKSLVEEKKTF